MRQWSGKKVETTTRKQKPCFYKIQHWLLLFLDPKQAFLYKVQLFLGRLLRVYLNQFVEARCPTSQQRWGWVFGFCRPDSFLVLFTCCVFGFVEAVLVFYKIWSPNPTRSFLGYTIYKNKLRIPVPSIQKKASAASASAKPHVPEGRAWWLDGCLPCLTLLSRHVAKTSPKFTCQASKKSGLRHPNAPEGRNCAWMAPSSS